MKQLSLWTEDDRDQLRHDYANGVRMDALCKRYGVGADHIRTWANQLKVKRPEWYLAEVAKEVGGRNAGLNPSEWGYSPRAAANIDALYAGRRYGSLRFDDQAPGNHRPPSRPETPVATGGSSAAIAVAA